MSLEFLSQTSNYLRELADRLRSEFMSTYLIGSAAIGEFVAGKSDVDLLVFRGSGAPTSDMSASLFEEVETNERPALSVCVRSCDALVSPTNPIFQASTTEMSWKVFSATEDALMVFDHGILLDGVDIRGRSNPPTQFETRLYLWARDRAIRSSSDARSVNERPIRSQAKDILRYSTELMYVWTGMYAYSRARLIQLADDSNAVGILEAIGIGTRALLGEEVTAGTLGQAVFALEREIEAREGDVEEPRLPPLGPRCPLNVERPRRWLAESDIAQLRSWKGYCAT
jgi:hypothetical protein